MEQQDSADHIPKNVKIGLKNPREIQESIYLRVYSLRSVFTEYTVKVYSEKLYAAGLIPKSICLGA